MLQLPYPRFPKQAEEFLRVSVCHVEDPHCFWIHRLDDQSRRDYNHINETIGPQASRLDKWDMRNMPAKGHLVMGPFNPGAPFAAGPPEYYRAKVLSVSQTGQDIYQRRVRLSFLDFGNVGEAFVRDLRVFPDVLISIPPLAVPCCLTGVRASLINNLNGEWTDNAKGWFKERTLDQQLHAKVRKARDAMIAILFFN